jgi:hypothetical protein
VDRSNYHDNFATERVQRPSQTRQNGDSQFDTEFQIVDHQKPLVTKENQWQKGNEKADFNAAVGRVTQWNAENFQGAYDAAAKNGTSVVFIVGSQNTRDTQDTLKNMEAIKAKNPGAEIVFLDKDMINNGGPRFQGLRDWVTTNTRNENSSFIAQYGVRPGKDGKAEGGKFVSSNWGSDTSGLLPQIEIGKMYSQQYKPEQYKFSDAQTAKKPEETVNPGAETPKRPLDVEKQYKELQDKMKLAREAKTAEEARKQYAARPSADGKDRGGAIAQADAIDQTAVRKELSQIGPAIANAEKELEASRTGSKELQGTAKQKLQALQETQRQLQALQDAPAQTRKEFAQRLLTEGKTLSADGKDKDSQARGQFLNSEGHALINEAATKVPGYFKSDDRQKELRAMGYGDQAIQNINKIGAMGPDLPAQYQITPNLFALTDSQREEMHKRSSDAKEEVWEPGQDVKDKQRAILEAAIKEAKEKNLPLVKKFGMRGCAPCDKMDKETVKPLAEALKGKAVVAAVDGFGAADVLNEHGFVSETNRGYPNVQIFDVNKAGNLSLQKDIESIGGKDAAIKDVTESVQAIHTARAEKAKREADAAAAAAAQRAAQLKALEDALQNEKLNRSLRESNPFAPPGHPYQFAGAWV